MRDSELKFLAPARLICFLYFEFYCPVEEAFFVKIEIVCFCGMVNEVWTVFLAFEWLRLWWEASLPPPTAEPEVLFI